MHRFAQAVLALLAGAATAAQAQPVTYKFDKKEGEVTIDRAAKTGKVEFTVDLTSVNTGVEHLNHHLQEADFFDSEKFPMATFVGEDFRFDGNDVSQMRGQLTLKGKTRP